MDEYLFFFFIGAGCGAAVMAVVLVLLNDKFRHAFEREAISHDAGRYVVCHGDQDSPQFRWNDELPPSAAQSKETP